MVATVYFVSYFLHNKNNDGWAYKVVNKYDSKDAARKAYHDELSNYINSEVYDNVAVTLSDSFGNQLESEWWQAPAPAPEPQPEPENNEPTEE